MARRDEEPDRELPLRLVGLARVPHCEPHVLRELLGEAAIVRESKAKPEDALRMPLDENAIGIALPGGGEEHERIVVAIAQPSFILDKA